MTCLSIIQNACAKLGNIAYPSAIVAVASTNSDARQLLTLANEVGEDIARSHNWSKLTKHQAFTATATQAQANHPPADYDRLASGTYLYNTDSRLKVTGPLDPMKWQAALTANVVGTPGYWTLIDNKFNLLPVPAATDDFRYVYISRNWAYTSGGTQSANGKPAFTLDNDETVLPERLMTLELIWRWKQMKGLDYAEDMKEAERQKEKFIARDRGPVETMTSAIPAEDIGSTWWPMQLPIS